MKKSPKSTVKSGASVKAKSGDKAVAKMSPQDKFKAMMTAKSGASGSPKSGAKKVKGKVAKKK